MRLYGGNFNPESSYWGLGEGRGIKCTTPICYSFTLAVFQQTCPGFATRTPTPFPVTGRVRWYDVMWHEMLDWKRGLKFLIFSLADTSSKNCFVQGKALWEMCFSAVSIRSASINELTSKTELIRRNSGKRARNLYSKLKIPSENLQEQCSNKRSLELGTRRV